MMTHLRRASSAQRQLDAVHWGVLNVRRVEVTSLAGSRDSTGRVPGTVGVESLNLSHNLLSSLGNEDLRDLPSLRELVLHNNLIKTVALGAFRHTAFIAKPTFSHNYITEVPPGIRQLTNLMNLYLQFQQNLHHTRQLRSTRDLVIQRRAFWRFDLAAIADSSRRRSRRRRLGGTVPARVTSFASFDLCAIGQARSLRGSQPDCNFLSMQLSEPPASLTGATGLGVYGFSPSAVRSRASKPALSPSSSFRFATVEDFGPGSIRGREHLVRLDQAGKFEAVKRIATMKAKVQHGSFCQPTFAASTAASASDSLYSCSLH
uniref:LRRCT domain-containing protein n=1 Tax=Macrostomum lignano TaxID=282301 RepID=A0A1I8F8L2_9PLAT